MEEDEEVARLKSEVKQVVANVFSFHQVSSEWSVDRNLGMKACSGGGGNLQTRRRKRKEER